jgi:hypothetical protein
MPIGFDHDQVGDRMATRQQHQQLLAPLEPATPDQHQRAAESSVAAGSLTATPVSSRSTRLWRVLTRADGRAPVWLEVLVIVWLLWLYDTINNLAPLRRLAALHNAASVLAFERSLNLAPELALDRWVAAHATLGLAVSYYYVFAHFFVTFGLLGWLWWNKPKLYRPLRTQLVLINVIGLAIFWCFPVAPPRMLASDGFTDIIAATHAVGDFHQGGLATVANQYAAMPSLHIAWATWCSLVVWRVSSNRIARTIAIVYPFVTAFVVLSTGNHFLVDVLAGAATTAAAVAIELAAGRWIGPYRRRRYGLAAWRASLVRDPATPAPLTASVLATNGVAADGATGIRTVLGPEANALVSQQVP